MKRVTKCDVCLCLLSLILLILGIFGVTVLPSIYDNIVHKTTVLSQSSYDESLGISTLLFSKPPMVNKMKFFFFNLTNMDEVVYEGAKPRVVEIGPYTFIESEEKMYMQFREDDTQIFYENYKKWIYHDDLSCATCKYEDSITIPNAVQIGAAAASFDPRFYISPTAKVLIAAFLLATGENPFNSPRVGDLLFDGYNDPMLTAAHSGVVKFLSDAFNGFDKTFVVIALAFIYPLPFLFALRMLIWRPFLAEAEGHAGPMHFLYTPGDGLANDIYQYAMLAYYIGCSLVEAAINTATLMVIFSRTDSKNSAAMRKAEIGLYMTTFSSFLIASVNVVSQTCIQLFPGSLAALIAMNGYSVIVDFMALSHVYLLLAFSPALRRHLFSPHDKENISNVATLSTTRH